MMWRFVQTLLLCSVLSGPQMHVSAQAPGTTDNFGILNETGIFSTTPTDSQAGKFLSPRAPNLVFLNHSIVNISVTANFTTGMILLYQRDNRNGDWTNARTEFDVSTYPWFNWNISSRDPTLPQEYAWRCIDWDKWAEDEDYNFTHPESFWSPMFRITNNPTEVVEQSVSASASATMLAPIIPSKTPVSTSTSALESESASANNAPLPTGGLSSTAKRDIALAVSLTLGGAAIIGVILLLLRRRHQKRKISKLSPAPSVRREQPPVAESHSYHAVPGKMQESKHTSDMPSELSGEGRVPCVEDLDELVTARRK